MQLRFRSALIVLAAGFALAVCSFSSSAQQAGAGAMAPATNHSDAIPDAPTPQIQVASNLNPDPDADAQATQSQPGQSQSDGSSSTQPASSSSQTAAAQGQSTQQSPANSDPAPASTSGAIKNNATQGSSNSQTQPGTQDSQHQTAEEQIKQQEQQRVVGVVPAFNTSYVWNAASMTAGQKMGLAFRSMIDPFQFGAAFLVAGYHEAFNDDPGFGWGPEGYFKRSGAAYLDAFDGAMIGNGILPSILHQDPRYFRMGPSRGTVKRRMFYALATNVVCRHDNTGKWQPNYSNVGGNIIAGAISNLYYPSQNSGWGQTITNGMIVTAEGGIGSIFQEFWPDISRKILHRDPTHGADAQAVNSRDTSK